MARWFGRKPRLLHSCTARHQARHAHVRRIEAVDLFGQGAPGVAQDRPRDRLEQRAIFFRHLIQGADEDAARALHRLGL